MKIVFAGTPHFADAALQALLAARFDVAAVFTQPDRPAGRGLKLAASAVKQTALAHDIAVHQPRSLKLDGKYPQDAGEAHAVLAALQPDVMVVAAYGLILPQWALDLPAKGCVNIHGSLLPRWRGAAPVHRAIEAGDSHSGVCLMNLELGLDTGGVYACESLAIDSAMTGGALHDALAHMGARMLCTHLPAIVAGTLLPVPQATEGIRYAHKLLREHGVLDWRKTAHELALQVRAYDPTPGCTFEYAGQTFKAWGAQALPETHSAPAGTVLQVAQQGIDIACAQGALRITHIQKPGGKRLAVSACWQGLHSQ